MSTFSRTYQYVLVFSMMLLLAGCWDRMEVNDLAIVVATGIDKTDDDLIELSVQLINPTALAGSQNTGPQNSTEATTVETISGKTISDAKSKLQEKVSRRLFWGHNHVIFIGEELAEEGIRKHIDFFARHPFARIRTYIYVSKGKAIEALKIVPNLERSSAEVAREFGILKVGMSVTVKELLETLSSESNALALPLIETVEKPKNKKGLRINGTAILKDAKMVGKIDDKMTRGLLWLRDEIDLAAVTISPKETEGQISFELLRSKTELIPDIQHMDWKVTVEITTEDDVVENETKLDVMNPNITKSLLQQLEDKIEKRIQGTLEQVQQEMNADVFGFAEAFHRKYPEEWKKVKDQWDEKFPEVKVEIKKKTYIRRPGSSTSPQGVPNDEVIK